MRSPLPIVGFLPGIFLAQILLAAEPAPPSVTPSAVAKEANLASLLKYESVIPKRELVFDQSEDEVRNYLPLDSSRLPPGMSPGLAARAVSPGVIARMVQDERYEATVAMKFHVPYLEPRRSDFPYHPSERSMLVGFERPSGPIDFFSDLNVSSNYDPNLSTGYFAGMLSRVPAERLPPSEVLKALVSQITSPPGIASRGQQSPQEFQALEMSRQYVRRGEGERQDVLLPVTFSLRAPTADRAKDLARALVVVFDYGGSLPKYAQYIELKQYYESKLPELQAAAKEAEEKHKEAQKALDKFNETAGKETLSKEEAATLTSQQHLIIVEEAGAKARIAAAEKALKTEPPERHPHDKFLANPNYDALVTLKTTAEIELASLAAKRAAIQEILDSSKKRAELAATRDRLGSAFREAQWRVTEAQRRLAVYRAAVEQKMPFAEVEGKVFIRRIKWEERTPPSRAGTPSGDSSPTPPSPPSRATRGKAK